MNKNKNKLKKLMILTVTTTMLLTILSFMPTGTAATTTILSEGFESWPTPGWVNGPLLPWSIWNWPAFSHTGNYYAEAYFGGDTLTSPSITFQSNTQLTFWYMLEPGATPFYLPWILDIQLDGITIDTLTILGNPADYTYQQYLVDLSSYSGDHTITFISQTQGNPLLSAGLALDDIQITTDTDTTPPVISDVQANPSIQIQGGSVDITCTVTDSSGIASVDIKIDYPNGPGIDETTAMTQGTGNTWSYTYTHDDSKGDPIGQYDFEIEAKDNSQNPTTSTGHSFEITDQTDTTPPVTTKTIGYPNCENELWVTSDTEFTLSAEDDVSGSGIKNTYYRYKYDGNWNPPKGTGVGKYSNFMIYSGPFTLDKGEGEYELRYYSEDNANNLEDNHIQYHKVDDTPPTTLATYGKTILYESDDGDGVNSCDVHFAVKTPGSSPKIEWFFHSSPVEIFLDPKDLDAPYYDAQSGLYIINYKEDIISYYSTDCLGNMEYKLILDQYSLEYSRGFPIRHARDGDWGAAQSFTPSMDTITAAEIYLRRFSNPQFDLTIELREDDPKTGALLETIAYPMEEVDTSWHWLHVDFTDVAVSPTTEYFIVLPPPPGGVTTSFGYEWGYAFGDQYLDGAFWFTRDGGALWRDLPTSYEFTFVTYGYT